MPHTHETNVAFCSALAKTEDEDRYLSALFAPIEKRADVFAVIAFGCELAATPRKVSEPMLGEIRLQWWREAIDEVFAGTPRKHPVVEALSEAVARRSLARTELEQVVDAHTGALYDDTPTDLGARGATADHIQGGLMRLIACVLCGTDRASRFASAIGEAGRAYGLAQTLQGNSPANLEAVEGHLEAARLALKGAPAELAPAWLPAALAPAYLVRGANLSPLRKRAILFWACLQGRP